MSGAIGSFAIGVSPIGGSGTPSPGSDQPYTPSVYLALPAQTQPIPGQLVIFQPSPLAAFQFQATFDGQPYQVVVTWNVYRVGWYVNVYNQSAVRVFTMPLIASTDSYFISLTAGYFASTLVFRASTQTFEVSP